MQPDHDIRDILSHDLQVLFCGINPGKSSAHTGYHFAHPGNRFWKVIYLAGFTRELLKPEQERRLLETGCGITALVERPTTQASELSGDELRDGGLRLQDKILRYQPRALAVLGKDAYQRAFRQRKVEWGEQPQPLMETRIWVLPNPSGLNRASLEEMVAAYRQLADALGLPERGQ
ncbi:MULTISPECIES: G/U mismatch-specific DNA glycosylase [Pantoea]|jgi:TDG/mug DNA glycosylase family protein|uniref:G/U mismatch-specific DNA glycosylase n=1 Tax=Pantoea eucrina TaxID=472693 RepID=A0ABS1Z364_9GAMM|nr:MULTISPECIES: G/U mismatch-specific DNA glycosylase [Pantoea]PPS64794.1 G/U mismatch-specific DNA glycosylase [Pantoea sp. BRM17]AIX49294.1 formamidopyrimidine-DNA glycosylase [Pantoea sp. PSNIH1]KAA6046629.1 G/U mismatch-specific DNA glycosylase [Pantoea sp. Bo_7]KAA6091858.1 G/U mismatch-specific DNA glycosylase [Pantoea sp. Bo_10]MBM0746849.1 G/U mismatch-specific DNA glycosylase [Pantoea eucrina]